VYNLRDAGGSVLAKPEQASLFGSVFVQAGGLGVASYHFDAPDNCYISYANAPENWILDDGRAPPARKPWTECSYNSETNTFRGVIHWDPAFGGMVQWDYEMIFSEDFAGVIGGQVKMLLANGGNHIHKFEAPWNLEYDDHQSLSYLRWTPPPTSVFGSVYVQGHIYSSFLEGIASYHFDDPDNCFISYSNAPPEWKLDDGSPPPEKKNFSNTSFDAVTRTFRGTIEWQVPFHGDSRWEYEMVFEEDFTVITSGQMRAYGADGTENQGTPFLNPRDVYARLRLGGGLCYVQKPGALTCQSRIMESIAESTHCEQPSYSPAADVDASSRVAMERRVDVQSRSAMENGNEFSAEGRFESASCRWVTLVAVLACCVAKLCASSRTGRVVS